MGVARNTVKADEFELRIRELFAAYPQMPATVGLRVSRQADGMHHAPTGTSVMVGDEALIAEGHPAIGSC